MRDSTRIGSAYEAMHLRVAREQRGRGLRYLTAGAAIALGLFMVTHLLGELGARVSADVARAATENCGAC